MRITKLLTLFTIVVLVTACGPKRIDGTSEVAFKNSVKEITQHLPENEREGFEGQVFEVYLNIRADMAGTINAMGDVDTAVRLEMDGLSKEDVEAVLREYQRRSLVRDQIIEGAKLAAGNRVAVQEVFLDWGRFPEDNNEAGFPDSGLFSEASGVKSILIQPEGRVEIHFGNGSAEEIDGKTLSLIPSVTDGGILDWSCQSKNVPVEYLPSDCKSTKASSGGKS